MIVHIVTKLFLLFIHQRILKQSITGYRPFHKM